MQAAKNIKVRRNELCQQHPSSVTWWVIEVMMIWPRLCMEVKICDNMVAFLCTMFPNDASLKKVNWESKRLLMFVDKWLALIIFKIR